MSVRVYNSKPIRARFTLGKCQCHWELLEKQIFLLWQAVNNKLSGWCNSSKLMTWFSFVWWLEGWSLVDLTWRLVFPPTSLDISFGSIITNQRCPWLIEPTTQQNRTSAWKIYSESSTFSMYSLLQFCSLESFLHSRKTTFPPHTKSTVNDFIPVEQYWCKSIYSE